MEVNGYNTGPEADQMNEFLAAAYESVIHDPPGWREYLKSVHREVGAFREKSLKSYLRGRKSPADLRQADLRWVRLHKMNLTGADLTSEP